MPQLVTVLTNTKDNFADQLCSRHEGPYTSIKRDKGLGAGENQKVSIYNVILVKKVVCLRDRKIRKPHNYINGGDASATAGPIVSNDQ
jgi:hypothetical protein